MLVAVMSATQRARRGRPVRRVHLHCAVTPTWRVVVNTSPSQHQPQVEVILLVEQGWGCRVCTDQSEGWELRCCLARGLTGAGCSWAQVWMAGRSSRVAHHPVFTCSRPNQCRVPGFPHHLSLQFSVATPCLFGPAVGGREVPGPY